MPVKKQSKAISAMSSVAAGAAVDISNMKSVYVAVGGFGSAKLALVAQ